jgi:hypothetical protein
MSVLNEIAWFQHRRDEIPNQILAKKLAEGDDVEGIAEIACNLWNPEPNIQSDCLKVLYEIAYLRPELAAPYYEDFLKLLKQRNNRLVWGGMIAIAAIAHLKVSELIEHDAEIRGAMEKGSVITVDNATKALAVLAAGNIDYRQKNFPYLLQHLDTCRPADFPRYAEFISMAVDDNNQASFIAVLNKHLGELSGGRAARVKKVLKNSRQ